VRSELEEYFAHPPWSKPERSPYHEANVREDLKFCEERCMFVYLRDCITCAKTLREKVRCLNDEDLRRGFYGREYEWRPRVYWEEFCSRDSKWNGSHVREAAIAKAEESVKCRERVIDFREERALCHKLERRDYEVFALFSDEVRRVPRSEEIKQLPCMVRGMPGDAHQLFCPGSTECCVHCRLDEILATDWDVVVNKETGDTRRDVMGECLDELERIGMETVHIPWEDFRLLISFSY